MSAESFLSSAIEAAIGMAGLAGIVAAIRHHDITDWPYLLGVFGILVDAFSFFPILLLGRSAERDAAA